MNNKEMNNDQKLIHLKHLIHEGIRDIELGDLYDGKKTFKNLIDDLEKNSSNSHS